LDNPRRVLFCNRVEYRREKNQSRDIHGDGPWMFPFSASFPRFGR
jgi:hypothetical protein